MQIIATMVCSCFAFLLSCGFECMAQSQATGQTPSRSEYFSWINNTNEGPDQKQTMINLEFFRWLHDEYGMCLDIYAFDAGTIDGAKIYGSTDSHIFKEKFPEGFGPVSRFAGQTGTRLGLWCGPDGFGETEKEARQRMEMMTCLVRDDNFALFKMDAVCGQLRPEKYGYFDEMMSTIRAYDPEFILLNHRLELGQGARHSTTWLMEGAETYIDVWMTNSVTAPHHRAEAISRKIPDGMTRLTEDHGVCLSSCLDFWQDDLILQAFNRNLILAPQIYGNPWILRDDEFADLAFIFNLHRDWRDILVNGRRLPESYGPEAAARGDGRTMFLTLRNLSWEPVHYTIRLDEEIGLKKAGKVKARQYHPYITDLGSHPYGTSLAVEVLPFRTALIKVTTEKEKDAVALSGIPYKIIKDRNVETAEIRLAGEPGERYVIRLDKGKVNCPELNESQLRALNSGRKVEVTIPGEKLKYPWYRKIADMKETDIPEDISSIYYASCFAGDSNPLEVRSLQRSGETTIPQVQAARDAFFNQPQFIGRELWDRYLFDDDTNTAFSLSWRWGDMRVRKEDSQFMLDMGKAMCLDSLTLHSFDEYSITPLKMMEGVVAYVSEDLREWKEIHFRAAPDMTIDLKSAGPVRFLRFNACPMRLREIYGYRDGKKVCREAWRASNLFHGYATGEGFFAHKVWKSEFELDEIPLGAYLCVAVNGIHGEDGAWAGFKIDGEYVGCPDRAPSYGSNSWECPVSRKDRNYTYYLPLTEDMKGKKIEAFVMALSKDRTDLTPEIRIYRK